LDIPKYLYSRSTFIIFPNTTVPLNIFEPRYLDMVNDSMKSDKLIGMIQPKNSKNENELKEFLLKYLPEVEVSISSDVCPEIREYERFTTTVVNSYIKPLISTYLKKKQIFLY